MKQVDHPKGSFFRAALMVLFSVTSTTNQTGRNFQLDASRPWSLEDLKSPGNAECPSWTNPDPASRPDARAGHAMAYDTESDRVILFGGAPPGGTWAYDFHRNQWTNMNPPVSPPVTTGHAMAYDHESDRVILFGGDDGFRDRRETWVYDFNTNAWTNMSPPLPPRERSAHAIVYDAQIDRVVLFGGCSGFPCQELGDTWTYDFNTNSWTNRNPAFAPSPRYGHAMAYYGRLGRCILFGGYDGNHKNDTWAYDFEVNAWRALNPAFPPLARRSHALVIDARSNSAILFGGCLAPCKRSSDLSRETWAYDYDANRWTDLDPARSPTRRWLFGMVYDRRSSRIILFGGSLGGGLISDETWTY